MERVAIYTCIIGGYDELLQPLATDPNFDFICFVGKGEKKEDRIGVWEIRESFYVGDTPSLTSRYVKMHPHEVLPGYEHSVWIDGNIQIAGPQIYKVVAAKIATGVLYAGIEHPSRDCIYEEAVKCRDMKYISRFKLARLHLFYWWAGIDRHAGLMETNVIFRKHWDERVLRFDELWWSKVSGMVGRDQLSQMWCFKVTGLPRDLILPPGTSTRNHPAFKYLQHK